MLKGTLNIDESDTATPIKEVYIGRDDNGDHIIRVSLTKALSKSARLTFTFFPTDPLNITIHDKQDPMTKYQLQRTTKSIEYKVLTSIAATQRSKTLGEVQKWMSYIAENGCQALSLASSLLSAQNSNSLIQSKLTISLMISLSFLNLRLDALGGSFIKATAENLRDQSALVLENNKSSDSPQRNRFLQQLNQK